jgi:hypothetical protein
MSSETESKKEQPKTTSVETSTNTNATTHSENTAELLYLNSPIPASIT